MIKSFLRRTACALLALGFSSCCITPPPPVPAPYKYLTLSGDIDGSEKFTFTPNQVQWAHLHWSEPSHLIFAGKPWTHPRQTPPQWSQYASLDLAHARIIQRKGRDLVALETTADGFILYFDDSPNGAAPYSVTIAIPRHPQKR